MLQTALSATFTYADYALVGLFALLFLICVFRGFSKALHGFFFALMIILSSLYLTGLMADPLVKSELGQQLYYSLNNSANGWGDAFTQDIFYINDVPHIYPSGSSEPVELSSVVGDNGFVKMIVNRAVPRVVPLEGGMSLKDVIVPNLSYILWYIICFIVFIIVLKLLFRLVEYLWDELTKRGRRYKPLDKAMGGLISLVYAAAFTLFVFAIVGVLADKPFMESTVDMLRDSTLSGWLFTNNPITIIFVRLFVG